ncbi:hypothetical protein BGZ83_007485 [Gryganskiella cystojenkinii]|nr:hypothetical protein BGZ83_007485 [Gryganskiella cystojenkinii]
MTANTVTYGFWCIIDGQTALDVFSVYVSEPDDGRKANVDNLKNAINNELKLTTAAKDLILWHVAIPIPDDDELRIVLNQNNVIKKLRPSADLEVAFADDPPDKTIRVIVRHSPQARASGKSSRIVDAMETLKNDYECIYVDLQAMNISSENEFWLSLCGRFNSLGYPLDFKDSNGFRTAFSSVNKTWRHLVILFFDEFDKLHQVAATEACSSILSAIRDIRNEPSRGMKEPKHVIHSVVSIGTYAILQLNQKNPALSPFNSSDNFQNTSLSLDQVRELYHEFAKDRQRTIEGRVIEDIFLQSNGHAGLVNVCGVALEARLAWLPNGQEANMNHWGSVVGNLLSEMQGYGTFQRLVTDLTEKSDSQVLALAFYRSRFLGNTSAMTVYVDGINERNLAAYLAALGVLLPAPGNNFKIASPLMDSLIRQTVIPKAYPDAPKTTSPKRSDGSLDILEVVKTALHFFDKELIAQACRWSYKSSPVRVNNNRNQPVPRESVYDSEMTRIFMNWLSSGNAVRVAGQNHVDNLYCDIVLRTTDLRSVALGLLATETPQQVQRHIERTVNYKNRIGANEGWVIHFTRQDNYLQNPQWPTDEILNSDINMIHIWHSETFAEVRLSTKCKNRDGQMITLENERII